MRQAHYLLLAGALLSASAHADWRQIPSREFPLKAPPAAGSAESALDYKLLEAAEANRREEDCALAAKQFEPSFGLFFYDPASPISAAEAKRAEPVASSVMQIAERVAGYHKGKFRRPRPYDVDNNLHPCVKKPGGSKSYPSSHAAAASAAACVLAAAYPAKATAIKAYGARLGELRVIVGVHHPSDVAAGASLGEAVCERLMKDEEFQAELEDLLLEPTSASAR